MGQRPGAWLPARGRRASATMPGSSTSASTRCAGCMPSAWCTSWTPSPTSIAPPSSTSAQLIWWFYADLKAYRREPTRAPPRRTAGALRPHLPPPHRLRHPRSPAAAAARQQGRTADGARPARRSRCTPTAPRTTSAARSPSARSAAAPTATPDAIAATPSSVSPRPAASSASPSGTISATGSPFPITQPSPACPISSAAAATRLIPLPGVLPRLHEGSSNLLKIWRALVDSNHRPTA